MNDAADHDTILGRSAFSAVTANCLKKANLLGIVVGSCHTICSTSTIHLRAVV